MNETKFSLHPIVESGTEGERQFEIRSGITMTKNMQRLLDISIFYIKKEGGLEEKVEPELQGLSDDRTSLCFKYGDRAGTDHRVEVKRRGNHVVGSPYLSSLKTGARNLQRKEIIGHGPDNNNVLYPPIQKTDGEIKASVASPLEAPRKVFSTTLSKVQFPPQNIKSRLSSQPSSSSSSPILDPTTEKKLRLDLSARIVWKKKLIIKSVSDGGILDGPQGFCILKSGSIVVADRKDQVVMFDSEGKFIREILGENGQNFHRPGDMTALSNGDFALKDSSGIQLFNARGVFLSRFWSNNYRWKCYGLVEDDTKKMWFIDCGVNETHVKCLDITGKNPFAISLKSLIGERVRESKCRFLTFAEGLLYVTDLGLDRVYVLDPNNPQQSRMFGSSGQRNGEFSDPAGLDVDQVGNIVVADSRNHRLCLFNNKGKWIKRLEVPVRRPSAIRLDMANNQKKDLYCLNLHGREALVKYSCG